MLNWNLFTYVSRFLVRCSYLEIYNEEIRDLLAKNQQHRLEVHSYNFVIGIFYEEFFQDQGKTRCWRLR